MNLISEGAIADLEDVIERENCQRVLFVVDEDAYRACGADAAVEPVLRNRIVSRFVGFEPNPKLADVQRGIEMSKALNPDVVVALGGGTALDLGKLIGALSVQSATARDIVIGRESIQQQGPPLIAIPTTAGTGSEATHFAVAYVGKEKHSVAHESLLPEFAIIDPRLTESLPATITAATGLDALCQAIESIWAVGATEESIGYATESVKIAVANIEQAVNSPNPAARMAMCQASHLAGRAINISKTTAPHALSYWLTSNFGIPHGVAVAVALGPMLTYNADISDGDCTDRRGAEHVRKRVAQIVALLGATSVHKACERFSEIVVNIGCPRTLAEAGVRTIDQLQGLVSSVNAERMSNNPRMATSASLVELLARSLDGDANHGSP